MPSTPHFGDGVAALIVDAEVALAALHPVEPPERVVGQRGAARAGRRDEAVVAVVGVAGRAVPGKVAARVVEDGGAVDVGDPVQVGEVLLEARQPPRGVEIEVAGDRAVAAGQRLAPAAKVVLERRERRDAGCGEAGRRVALADLRHLAGGQMIVDEEVAVAMGDADAPPGRVVERGDRAERAGLAHHPAERVVSKGQRMPRLRGAGHPAEQVVLVGDVGLGAGPVLQRQAAERVEGEADLLPVAQAADGDVAGRVAGQLLEGRAVARRGGREIGAAEAIVAVIAEGGDVALAVGQSRDPAVGRIARARLRRLERRADRGAQPLRQ